VEHGKGGNVGALKVQSMEWPVPIFFFLLQTSAWQAADGFFEPLESRMMGTVSEVTAQFFGFRMVSSVFSAKSRLILFLVTWNVGRADWFFEPPGRTLWWRSVRIFSFRVKQLWFGQSRLIR